MQNRWSGRLIVTLVAIVVLLNTPTHSQERKFLSPANQVVAIHAGKLFDAKSGNLLNNQIVLIRGERIADVGPNIQIPREARVIDLGSATTTVAASVNGFTYLNVLPGLGMGHSAQEAFNQMHDE